MLRRSLIAAAFLLAAAPAAHAGGYVSVGVGQAPSLGGDLDKMVSTTGHSGRVGVGMGFGPLSIEAALGEYGVAAPGAVDRNGTALDVSVSAMLRAKLSGGLGVYGKGGLERASVLVPDGEGTTRAWGSGYVLGVGLDYQLDLAIAKTSIWLEGTRESLDVSTMSASYQGNAETLMLGLRFGI
jgi:hypothetical protein